MPDDPFRLSYQLPGEAGWHPIVPPLTLQPGEHLLLVRAGNDTILASNLAPGVRALLEAMSPEERRRTLAELPWCLDCGEVSAQCNCERRRD